MDRIIHYIKKGDTLIKVLCSESTPLNKRDLKEVSKLPLTDFRWSTKEKVFLSKDISLDSGKLTNVSMSPDKKLLIATFRR